MPPKRLHELFDNDTGEGTSNINKIWIVRGAENDSDEGVKKIGIVRGGDNNDEGIMCEDCSQILYSAASLARHKEMIHGRETEKFICYDCGRILKTSKQLHNHQRKHETFVCEKCTKSFSMNNKQKHIREDIQKKNCIKSEIGIIYLTPLPPPT